MRIWRHVESLKRSGQAFGIGDYLPEHYATSTAVLCGLCPQPGINMNSNWKLTDHKKRYSVWSCGSMTFTHYYGLDTFMHYTSLRMPISGSIEGESPGI